MMMLLLLIMFTVIIIIISSSSSKIYNLHRSPIEHFHMNYLHSIYEGWNFNSDNYLFTTDTKQIHVSKFYCPSL